MQHLIEPKELFNAIATKHFYAPSELYSELVRLKPSQLREIHGGEDTSSRLLNLLMDDMDYLGDDFADSIMGPFPQLHLEYRNLRQQQFLKVALAS